MTVTPRPAAGQRNDQLADPDQRNPLPHLACLYASVLIIMVILAIHWLA